MASLASYSSLVSDPNQSTSSYGFSKDYIETCSPQLFDGGARKHRSPLECRSAWCAKGAEFGSCKLKRRSDKAALKSRSLSLHVACVASSNGPEHPRSSFGIAPSEPATEESPAGQPVASPETELDDNFKLHCLTEAGGDDGDGNDTFGNSRGGGGGGGDNGNGDGGSNDDDDDDNEEREFGSLLNEEEVSRQIKARGITLPMDMAEAAKTVGIRSLVLHRFMDLQASRWPLGAAIRASGMLRNRMLADQGFLFKLLTEIAIDSGCATFAEVKKRGDDFWDEFELYMADLIVGVVVDAALVGMLAPFVQFRRAAPSTGMMAHLSRSIQALPSSVFEAATPGRRFSIQQRVASFFYKGLQYGVVGFSCGIIGQGIANSIMLLKRKLKKSEKEDVPVPPLVKSAALWGVFLAVSSNTRYQIVNGLERVVEGSPVAKRLPLVAMAFTVCIRFANNTYGGMQFVDWARWSGCQ